MHSDVTDLLGDLVAIDSVNPSLVEGGAGEGRIAGFIADWARAAGLEATLLEGTPGRPSVIVRARGSGGGRTLLLCGHIDTVNVEGMDAPHALRIDGDRAYRRGARGADPLAARPRLRARVGDRGRRRAVELSGPLRGRARAPDAARRDPG